MNTMVQLTTRYTDDQRHNTLRHRLTDGRTDRRQYHANNRSYCVTCHRPGQCVGDSVTGSKTVT